MARQTREEREQEVRKQYEAVTDRLYTDRQAFKDFLSFSGKHYKLPAEHTMMIFSSNPNADMVTDYDTWQKLGRQVTRNQRSMAAFENGKLRHYFDISQTEGKPIRPRWHFDKNTAAAFTAEVSALEGKQFSSITSCVDYFSDSQTYGQIANLTKALNVDADKRKAFSQSVGTMVRAVVAARCGYNSKFNYKSDPLDLSALDMLHSKAELEKLTDFIQINAKAVLLSMEKTVNEIQRRNSYEQGHDKGRNSPDMVRGGQQVLPRDNRGERQNVQARPEDVRISGGTVAGTDGRGRGADEESDRTLRSSVAEVHGGELPIRDNRAEGQNEMGTDTPADRQGSRGIGVEHGAGVRPEVSAPDNVSGNRSVGEDEAARGGSPSDDRLGSSAQSISKTAEADTAPAVSVSEKSFAEQVDESLSGKLSFYTNLKLGDTPEILISAGLRQLPMLYTQKHLKDAVAQRNDNKHRHGLSVEQIKTIPEKLVSPIIIYDSFSRNDSVVAVINDYDQNDNPIIVSIKPDGTGRYEVEEIESNFVTSIYSKENFKETFNRSISEDKLLYCDKKQTQEMFERWGLQLPELTNSLAFNTIIHQSRNIVKGSEQEISETSDKQKSQEMFERWGEQYSELTNTPDLDNSIHQADENVKLSESENEIKSQEMFRVLGLQFPKGVNTPDFNNSIHPADENVKGSDPENDLLIAADALNSYAYTQLLFYDANLREASQSSNRDAFNTAVGTALDNIISDVVSERISPESFYRSCTMKQFMVLYKEMLEDQEYKDKFTEKLADKLYEEHQRQNEVRAYAHANGIPFRETPADPDELYDPFAYDGSMSVEDAVLAADANNLERIMNERSEELKSSAIPFSRDEFNSHFTEQAEKALREYAAEHSSESWYKDMLNDPEHLKKVSNLVAPAMYNELREEMQQKDITYPAVYVTGSFQRNFDVQSVGFEIGKSYTVEEFNAALNKANEIWNNDEKNEDKLNSINVSIHMDEHTQHSYEVELYAMYHSIGEVIDIKPSSKPTNELSELKAAVSAIENPALNSEEKTEPSKHIEFEDNPLAHSVFDDSKSSISQPSSVVKPTENRATYSTKSDEQKQEPTWTPYIIADLKTWADNNAESSKLEHFATFEEAKARFDELRSQPYNSEETRNENGSPYARLTLGIEAKNGAADVIHVRAGQNYLVDDFTRQPSILSNSSAMELINRAESEIGFDRVFSFKKLDNGSYDNGTDLSFSEWNNENHIFAEKPQQKLPTITCNWSESPEFEDGKTYSVLEFDTIMKQADEEHISARKAGLEKYGSDEEWESADKDDYYRWLGYDKTNFTVNLSNGDSFTERQDIGDGYGGVIDFLSQYKIYSKAVEELRAAANSEQKQQLTERSQERVQETERSQQSSFHITDETDIGTGGLKTKFQNNIAAITTLKTIESESRSATPEEQKILAKYVGWGGMPQAFDQANEQWSKEYKQLRELLTDDEYKAAAESTLNAHYTSPEIIGAMYKALNNFGFNGGNVLEPAMGVGNFFGCMPESMNNDSRLYGVELDSLTGRIAQQLYPQADIRVQGFEKSDFPDNFFDAAIGNVPFGNYGVADRRYDKEHFLIHDYFFAKTLDKVAPGGVVAFVTSKGTLDKTNPKVREYLAKRADLIGAIRLPNNAFKNANTEVTSDIIFLQKREKMAVEMPDWAYTGRNSDGMPINQYFIDHPDMVLGKLEYTTGAYGQEVTCTPIEGEKLSEQLDRAVAKLRADMKVQKREERQDKERGIIPATADVQNFTHTLVDGKLYFRENNVMTEVKQTGKDLERMKGLHGLRQTLRELIDAQSHSCSDEELHGLQAKLNTQYDSFKKEYGSINDRLNANVFRCDDDYNTLCSLEIVNAEKKTTQKSDIFTQRTIKPTVDVTHVETPQEAMQVSLDMKGRIDISYMAQLCDREPEQVVNELVQSNQIYLNPEKYVESEPLEGYEESSEYLSGNVREKLRAAERAAKDNPELFGRNVAGLTDNLPQTIGAGDITTHLGASWIDVRDYERFLKEYIGRDLPGVTLRRTSAGEYKVENKTFDKSVAATNTYGTERMSAYHIFENLLNHRDVTVKDRVDLGEDKYKYVVNTKQTQLATEKARQMNEAFSKWVWAKPERRDKYVTRYNELFNSIVLKG